MQSLSSISEWYYSVLDLWEDADEELPVEHWATDAGIKEVMARAFGSSDCGNFAAILHEMTGYPLMNLIGPGGAPVHSFVQTPEGDAIDIHGVRPVSKVARAYGFKGRDPVIINVRPGDACGCYLGQDVEDGIDEEAVRVASVIRQIPWAPFNTPDFQRMSNAPLRGVDFPEKDEPALRSALGACKIR